MRMLHCSLAAPVAETQQSAGSPAFVQSVGRITRHSAVASVVVVGGAGADVEVEVEVLVDVVLGAALVVVCEYARPPRSSSNAAASPRYRIAVRLITASSSLRS